MSTYCVNSTKLNITVVFQLTDKEVATGSAIVAEEYKHNY